MKTLVLLCSLFISSLGIAQDPDLAGTWYFTAFLSDLEAPDYLTEEDSPVNPTLIIHEDLSFEGIGACNTFTGEFAYNPDTGKYAPINFSVTNDDCGQTSYNDFEYWYFSHFNELNEGPYEMMVYINSDTGEGSLEINFSPGFGMYFQKTPFLRIPSIELSSLNLFPNPALDVLNIQWQQDAPLSVSIYTLLGQQIVTPISSRKLDVSDLSNGVYLVEVVSEGQRTVKKFVKR